MVVQLEKGFTFLANASLAITKVIFCLISFGKQNLRKGTRGKVLTGVWDCSGALSPGIEEGKEPMT